MTAHDRTLLLQHGGHIELTRDWALSLLSRIGFVKRKATTKAKSQYSEEEFHQLKNTFSGQFLPMQLLYTGKTDRCHLKQSFPNAFDVFHTSNHWAIEDTCERFTEKTLFPMSTKFEKRSISQTNLPSSSWTRTEDERSPDNAGGDEDHRHVCAS